MLKLILLFSLFLACAAQHDCGRVFGSPPFNCVEACCKKLEGQFVTEVIGRGNTVYFNAKFPDNIFDKCCEEMRSTCGPAEVSANCSHDGFDESGAC
jgi:hypothetical protein